MDFKISKGVKNKFSFPLYLVLYGIASLIGFIEGGILGLAVGLASALFCSLLTFLSIIPFIGIFLYFIYADKCNSLLASVADKAPIAQEFSKWSFGIFAVIVNLFVSFVVLIVLLALFLRRKNI